MAKKKNTSLYSLIIKLAVSAVLLISVTTAWFIFTQEANVDTLGLDVAKTTSVSVKDSDGSWTQKLEITHESEGAVAITEFSGNGKSLFGPVSINKQVVSFYPAPDLAANNGYIDFTLDFKSDGPVDIYLSEGSALIAESFEGNLNDNGVSKNYIVGAVRMAMWCDADDSEPVIWAPNSLYEYNATTKKINTNGKVETEYLYATDESVDNMITIQTNGQSNGISENGCFVWGDLAALQIADMKPVMTLQPEENSEQIKTLHIRLWVEGTDREAVKDFIGGRFKIKLNFTAVVQEGVVTE